MDCRQVRELLTAYLDDEVTLDERGQLEAHLAKCPVCRHELDLLKEAQESLRHALQSEAAHADPPPQAWSQFQLALDAQRPSFLFLFRRRRWRIIATVIIVAIVITLAVLWGTGILPGVRG
jgi:anti-sigma factor RsiW